MLREVVHCRNVPVANKERTTIRHLYSGASCGFVPKELPANVNSVSMNAGRSLAKEQGVHNVEFVEGNAQDLRAFEIESFDAVHTHQLLLHLPNPLDAMREMRRLVKPGGIVSTRDNADRIPIPLIEGVKRSMTLFDRFSRSRGADPEFGRVNHLVAREAGFEWDKVEMSSWGWEMSGKEDREIWVQGARNGARHGLTSSGFATEEECDEIARAWDDWGQRLEGRFMALDGALLCWK